MESQLWLFISGGQLPEGTTGPCAAEVLLENSNKGSLKSSQSPLMWRAKGWPSSAPLPEWFYLVAISPYWVCYLAAARAQTWSLFPCTRSGQWLLRAVIPSVPRRNFCKELCSAGDQPMALQVWPETKCPASCSQGVILCRKLKTQNGKPNFSYFL